MSQIETSSNRQRVTVATVWPSFSISGASLHSNGMKPIEQAFNMPASYFFLILTANSSVSSNTGSPVNTPFSMRRSFQMPIGNWALTVP